MMGLEAVFGNSAVLSPAPIAKAVHERFLASLAEHNAVEIRPAFHGTNVVNHKSIFERGLLIPGRGNELKIVHGAVHGQGVYTANVDAAWLSKGFCSDPCMLVCAVLQSQVRYAGDAM